MRCVIYPLQSESGIPDHLPGPVNRTLFYRDRIATQAAAGPTYQESTGKDRFPATMSPRPELRHNHRHRKTFVNLQKGAGRREGLCIERIKMAPGLGSSRIACLGGRTDRREGGLCLAVKDIFIPWANSTVEQSSDGFVV